MNELNEAFQVVNPEHVKKYGHFMEGVKHNTNDARLNQLEQNKLGILMDNAVKNYCYFHGLRNGSIETIREMMNTTADAAAFITSELPMIKNAFNNSIIRNLVSIQPMTQSSKKVHYWDVVREDGTSLTSNVYDNQDYSNNEEYNESDPTAIKKIKAKITGTTIESENKKLGAEWTVEAEQDMAADYGINLGTELTNEVSAQVVREWDYTVIKDMFLNATGGNATFNKSIPSGITYTDKKVWMEELYNAMIDVDTQIYTKVFKKTNWCLVDPIIAGFIEKMAGFVASNVAVDQQIVATGGRYYTGNLNKRWNIYVDPYLPTGKILMGYNGTSWLDTAYVFAPYVMAYLFEVETNTKTQTRFRSIMSRCGKFFARPNMLGTVTVTGS